MGKGQHLGELELLIMLALAQLGRNAYGVTLREEISTRADRDVAIGSVYATLDRLEAKGYVAHRIGEPTAERGGRAKKYFHLEALGRRVLRESLKATDAMRFGLRPALAGTR